MAQYEKTWILRGSDTLFTLACLLIVFASCCPDLAAQAEKGTPFVVSSPKVDTSALLAAALSGNGSEVAMLYQASHSGQSRSTRLTLIESTQGQLLADVFLPSIARGREAREYRPSHSLLYCDNGQTIVAFDGAATFHLLDGSSLAEHATIDLSSLVVQSGQRRRSFDSIDWQGLTAVDCASKAPVFAVISRADQGFRSFKFFDSTNGSELVDLNDLPLFDNRLYQGKGFAISPDGRTFAILTSGGSVPGDMIDVVDRRTKQIVNELHLPDVIAREHLLRFASNQALLIGDPSCELSPACTEEVSVDHSLLLWQIVSGTKTRLGWPGESTYRSFDASADGKTVFSYSGDEKYCRSCSHGDGELRVHSAHFVIWSLPSATVVERSPPLPVNKSGCPAFQPIGHCTASEDVPEMQISNDGRTVLVITASEAKRGTKPNGTLLLYHTPQ